ncbi:alpha/beta family hydrolase [Alsobacter sp. KACC 23698]|uniref:Alpha/beta family hydrolase n=1 Tax=Alsobacter sp. KACC 23698 TaxID=3149229 RepID=A0AAU7JDI2_9HYPH
MNSASDFLDDGPHHSPATLLLAHGAGGAMDSAGMQSATEALVAAGLRVLRFEFDYMAARRTGGRKPPPKAETLVPEYGAAVAAARAYIGSERLVVGGKSMGGRVASKVADDLHNTGDIAGLLCLGYPFHPPGRPTKTRTAHLEALHVPTLIVQGTRDPFGTEEEVAGYTLSPSIELLWMSDGDHDLMPRKGVSGFNAADHRAAMAASVRAWVERLR